jgi:hypothetical protein
MPAMIDENLQDQAGVDDMERVQHETEVLDQTGRDLVLGQC